MKRLVAVAQLALCFVFVFCNSGDGQTRPAELVGQWEHASGTTSRKLEKLELFKDGTGVVDGGGSVSWKVENKRFVILSPSFTLSCNYKVSGYELALAYDDGGRAIFVRKGKLEEFKAKLARVFEQLPKFTDSRDSKVYRKVTIGGQTWMAENLNFAAEGSKCYENKAENCEKYGRLYNWATALKACPAGWHLPSDDEWAALENAVGGSSMAGTKLKSAAGWDKDGNGTNDFGWSALPGGYGHSNGFSYDAGRNGYWWSATEYNEIQAKIRGMSYAEGSVNEGINYEYEKSTMYPVRCVQDK